MKARFYDMAIRRIVADFGEVQDCAAEWVVYERQDKTPQVYCTTCEIFLIHAGPHCRGAAAPRSGAHTQDTRALCEARAVRGGHCPALLPSLP